MRNRVLLFAGMLAVLAVTGCSDNNPPETPTAEHSVEASDGGGGPAASDGEGAGPNDAAPSGTSTVAPEEASGSSAPTVDAQEPGSPLAVKGIQVKSPEGWNVSGVSSSDDSEVVSAVSDDGQFLSVRSVRSESTVDEQIAQTLEADAEQTTEAPELDADGETLRGVETGLTASGGEAIQLQYFARRGDSLITIDVVTTAEQKDALLEHLSSGLTWT